MQVLNTSNEFKLKSEKESIDFKNEDSEHSSCNNKSVLHIIILIVLIILISSLIIIIIIIINKQDKKKIINCDVGYFLEKDENKCLKCPLTNCKKCEGSLINNSCISCFSSYKPIILKNKIISCELDASKEINYSIIINTDLIDDLNKTTDNIFHNNTYLNSMINKTFNDTSEENEKSEIINQKNSVKFIITSNISNNGITYDLINTDFTQRISNYKINKDMSADTIFINNSEKISTEDIIIDEVVCEPGYFRDSESNTCNECSVHNCENCTGNIGNDLCASCFESFFPTYQNSYIISCDYCELGDEDKCLECDENNFVCSRCNDGFQLINGQCTNEYSFEAIYETNSYNQNIKLINNGYLRYINKMIIDGENMSPKSNVSFYRPGNHTIYFKIDNNLNSFSYMFNNVTSLISINFYSNFNTENVTYMSGMFKNCYSLTSININNFNTKNVQVMFEMFSYCTSLKSLDLSNFDTGIVREFYQMFYNCYSLTSLLVSNFDTRRSEDMDEMFFNCHSLTSLNLSSFNTNNVHYMLSMFSNCTSLKYLDISNFNKKYVNYFDCRNIFSSINANVTIYINLDFYNILFEKNEIHSLRFRVTG